MKKYNEIIIDSKESEILLRECIAELYKNGAVDISKIELITAIKMFHPKMFSQYEKQILTRMGLFFKPIEIETFEDHVFQIFRDYIVETYNSNFTPIQFDIIDKIEKNQVFSFSSPTSTGKSYIFRYLLSYFKNDIVIIVPSRALINEYFKKISEIYNDKYTNVLTYVDIINTKHAKRNIFIITPERTKDLFNNKDKLNLDLMLFDEAQLSDESSVRGMYFDSVVRRAVLHFPNAKFVFAHPFISNPEMQFTKNNIEFIEKDFRPYKFMNVGQIYFSYKENQFFHFRIGSSKRTDKIPYKYDPLEEVIKQKGSAFVYCSKAKIYDGRIKNSFKKYIDLCEEITAPYALELIEKIRIYIGASDKSEGNYVSEMITAMKRGVVFHHGSLPLRVRSLIEEFTQKGYCRICFATSTLEQGINMPFDLVWIDRFEPSKPLDVKNLVGRAGRSTNSAVFDYGKIVIKDSSRVDLRMIISNDVSLKSTSELDIIIDSTDEYIEYKEAIKNNTFSEEYNLTHTELKRIEDGTSEYIKNILNKVYIDGKLDYSVFNSEIDIRNQIIDSFIQIYVAYLGRELVDAEKYILTTTVKILFWRVRGKKFNQIVSYRYSYSARIIERKKLEESFRNTPDSIERKKLLENISKMESIRLTKFASIPNKKLRPVYINYDYKGNSIKRAVDVDFDSIVVDTYDYIDKLIGFRLGDVYFAAFKKFYENPNNIDILRNRAKAMTNYIKYGTDDELEIWLLRYGFEFEDFDWLLHIVDSVDEREIKFKNLEGLSDEQLNQINKYI